MEEWESVKEAHERKGYRARQLWEILYAELEEREPEASPETLVLEIHARIMKRRPKIVWRTDKPDEFIDKVERNNAPPIDEEAEDIIREMEEKTKIICPKRIDACYATIELYLMVRKYEDPTSETRGKVIYEDTTIERIDEISNAMFGQTYGEIKGKVR